MKQMLYLGRIAVTLLAAIAALAVGRWIWGRYEIDPWTRDGRVRADVVQAAPDVSGLVTDVRVQDNAPVKKGDVLFVLDRPRYQLALDQAQAALATQTAALAQARREDARNRKLGDLVAAEVSEQGRTKTEQLEAAVAQAKVNRDLAKLNLDRTTVVATVDGIAANVQLQPGDYAAAGHPVVAVLDLSSVHVDGYFEETKLPRIHVGDPVSVRLMGETAPLHGHVDSIAAGIEDRERGASNNMLPNVNPTFSWVRLAQRIPVRVKLDKVPANIRLIAGRTATVTVEPVLSTAKAKS